MASIVGRASLLGAIGRTDGWPGLVLYFRPSMISLVAHVMRSYCYELGVLETDYTSETGFVFVSYYYYYHH